MIDKIYTKIPESIAKATTFSQALTYQAIAKDDYAVATAAIFLLCKDFQDTSIEALFGGLIAKAVKEVKKGTKFTSSTSANAAIIISLMTNTRQSNLQLFTKASPDLLVRLRILNDGLYS